MSRISAVQAAGDALNELGIDQSRPIDPFEAIEDTGLVLRFAEMTHLLGATLPGRPGGVLINKDRPASLQRYTAAHELGHWFMHQDFLSLDDVDHVLHHGGSSRELDAQVFAAHFLMPLELLYPTARRHGVQGREQASPEQVYQIARDMNVSYEAAARQLASTPLVSRGQLDRLLKARPADIKKRLTNGTVLPDARGDVWIIDQPDTGAAIHAFVGDAIFLRLTEYASAGYRWCADNALSEAVSDRFHNSVPPAPFGERRAFHGEEPTSDAEIIPFPKTDLGSEVITLLRDEVIRERYRVGETRIGGHSTRMVAYTASATGKESIRLSHVRPIRPNSPVEHLEVVTLVRGVPEVEFRGRLLAAFARSEEEEW